MSLSILEASTVTSDEVSSIQKRKGLHGLIQRHHIRNAEKAARKERYHTEKAELYVRKASEDQLTERDRNKLLRQAAKQQASAAYHLSIAAKHNRAARKGQAAPPIVGVSTELNNVQAAGLVPAVGAEKRSTQLPAYVYSYPTEDDDDSEDTCEELPQFRRDLMRPQRFASPSRLGVAQQESPSWKRRKAPITRHQLRKGSRSLQSTRTVERNGNWLMAGHLQKQRRKLRGTFVRNNSAIYITPTQLALASGKLNHVELHKETSRFALKQLKRESKQVRKNTQVISSRTVEIGQQRPLFSSSDLRTKYRDLRSTYTVESNGYNKVTTAQLQQAAKSLNKILDGKDPSESKNMPLTPTQFRSQASQLHHITFTKGCSPRFSAIEFQDVGSRLNHVIPKVGLCLSRRVSPALLMRASNKLQPTQTIVKGSLAAFAATDEWAKHKADKHSASQLQKLSTSKEEQSSFPMTAVPVPQ